jgi:polyisoprenoid-binding protein YceI
MKGVILTGASLLLATTVYAEQHAIDTKQSTLTIHVGKTGALSAFGHEHEIRGAIQNGSADTGEHPSVEVHVNARALKVIDKDASEKERAEVQKTMLGPEVLDSQRFGDIMFKSTSSKPDGDGKWILQGDLTLHGKSKPVNVHVQQKDGHYTGSVVVKQTDYGIKPPGKAGVRAKDEVQIVFDVRLER